MKRAQRDRVGATRGKLALVGVLAVVLVYVLASSFGGGGAGDAAPTAAEAAAPSGEMTADEVATQSAQATSPGGNPFGEFAEDEHWPTPALDKLISFDPLAAPPWMAPAELAAAAAGEHEDAATLEELRNAASAIIFIADGQRVARIGAQDYHVGDFVGPYQITDISSAGIVLSEPTSGR